MVGITIDQLRGDYLEMFRYIYGDRGFNRLLDEGLVYSNIHYEFPNLDKASTIATIYTGANPSYHGITAENRYLVETHQRYPPSWTTTIWAISLPKSYRHCPEGIYHYR